MLQRLSDLWGAYGPTDPSGELAVMAGVFAVLILLISLILPVLVWYGGGVALGLWLAAQYCWLRGC